MGSSFSWFQFVSKFNSSSVGDKISLYLLVPLLWSINSAMFLKGRIVRSIDLFCVWDSSNIQSVVPTPIVLKSLVCFLSPGQSLFLMAGPCLCLVIPDKEIPSPKYKGSCWVLLLYEGICCLWNLVYLIYFLNYILLMMLLQFSQFPPSTLYPPHPLASPT